jgi:hypothetical protein
MIHRYWVNKEDLRKAIGDYNAKSEILHSSTTAESAIEGADRYGYDAPVSIVYAILPDSDKYPYHAIGRKKEGYIQLYSGRVKAQDYDFVFRADNVTGEWSDGGDGDYMRRFFPVSAFSRMENLTSCLVTSAMHSICYRVDVTEEKKEIWVSVMGSEAENCKYNYDFFGWVFGDDILELFCDWLNDSENHGCNDWKLSSFRF